MKAAMNIAMFTNTYLPQVGGVANSVHGFAAAMRARGHRVLVAAPEYAGETADTPEVVRIAAIQRFNGSDFSMAVPASVGLRSRLQQFRPDLLHSHHPYLVGDTALRLATAWAIPLVFTHHTMYEHFTHYVPLEMPGIRKFVKRQATVYANLCDRVIAPSESVRDIIRDRGVTTPVDVLPTGVDRDRFAGGDPARARDRFGIPDEAFVIGHVGRLAPEKNLAFLAEAVAAVLQERDAARFVVVGKGPAGAAMAAIMRDEGVADRFIAAGKLTGGELADAYRMMDVFAFSSLSETQGMVVAEAMAAGIPVVALDAPGIREVVTDGENGRLLSRQDPDAFADALCSIMDSDREAYNTLCDNAAATAERFDAERCADRLEALYRTTLAGEKKARSVDHGEWKTLLDLIHKEWSLWSARLGAFTDAVSDGDTSE